ncbi:Myblike DNAbinding domain-containing protein [Linnemannia zychae]|nr:Myblike DNAbinding domain-containing protein [Linnemannia zychae]
MYFKHSIDWRTIGVVLNRPYTTCYSRFLNTIKPALDKGEAMQEIKDQARLAQFVERGKAAIKERKEAAAAAAALVKSARSSSSIGAGAGAKKTSPTTATVQVKKGWDAAIDQTIKDMVQAGSSWPDIGRAVGRPFSSCYSRYYASLDPALDTPWTQESIERLKELALQGVSWKKIGQELKIKSLTCKIKWTEIGKEELAVAATQDDSESLDGDDQYPLLTSATSGELDSAKEGSSRSKMIVFSTEESALIVDLAERYGTEDWDKILHEFQQHFLSDTSEAFSKTRHRSSRERILSMSVPHLHRQYVRLTRNKSVWTFDQETTLIQQVLKHGTEGHWDEIAQLTGLHSPEECRTHWKNLDMPVMPNYNAWTKTEQGTFWSAWQQFGSDFKRISKFCSNRTADDCQRYFEAITKDFPNPDQEPDAFQEQIKVLQENLPYTRQKYLFTKDRSLRLQSAMRFCHQRFGASPTMHAGTWQWIADKVHRGLSPSSCVEHWNYLRQNLDVIYGPLEEGQTILKPHSHSSWSHEESKLLDQGIRELGASWVDIKHRYLPWRTSRSIRQRWFIMSDKSTKVTEDEYYTILAAGKTADSIDYDDLTQKLPGWNSSPCRRVFETSYKHIVATTVWQPEEDRRLIEVTLKEYGRDWHAIAKHFKGIQPAMAPLYQEAMERERTSGILPQHPPARTHKTAWQCRLRWCQLVEPLMPKAPILTISEHGRSTVLRLSKKLLSQ